MKRRRCLIGVVVLCLASPLFSSNESSYETCFRSRVNSERTSRGIRALKVDIRIDRIARIHSDRMAARGEIFHNDNLARELPPFEYAGENVGMGPSCEAVGTAFMDSASHRRVILAREYVYLGVGVTVDEGTVFVTLDLFTPKVSKPKPKPSPKPSPCRCR